MTDWLQAWGETIIIAVFGVLWLVGVVLMELDYNAKFWSMHRRRRDDDEGGNGEGGGDAR